MMATANRQTPARYRTVLATAVAAMGLAWMAATHAAAAPVDLQVVDRESGQPLRVWRHDGHLYVAGTPGDRYGLRVTNHTDGRVLVVMSVDGVNIITGETAGYDQRGYIFAPHEFVRARWVAQDPHRSGRFHLRPAAAVLRGAHRPAGERGGDRHRRLQRARPAGRRRDVRALA